MKKAKAAVIVAANEPFEIREYDILKPEKGMCGMELIASGVCGTDIHIQEGKLGPVGTQIIGHEFIGRLDAIDPVEGLTYGLKKGEMFLWTSRAPAVNVFCVKRVTMPTVSIWAARIRPVPMFRLIFTAATASTASRPSKTWLRFLTAWIPKPSVFSRAPDLRVCTLSEWAGSAA